MTGTEPVVPPARRSGMRVVRVSLVAVVGLLGSLLLVVGGAAPAAACSCAGVGLARYVEMADVVVTGVLEDVEEPDDGLFGGPTGTAEYRVRVESTHKGRATEDLVFTSAADGSSCGVEGIDADRRYVFFLTRGQAELSSSLCSGNQPASSALDRRLAALVGPATAPVPGGPDGGPGEGPDRDWWLPATGAVLAGLGAVGVLVRRRRTASRP